VRTVQNYVVEPKDSQVSTLGPLDVDGYRKERINGQIRLRASWAGVALCWNGVSRRKWPLAIPTQDFSYEVCSLESRSHQVSA